MGVADTSGSSGAKLFTLSVRDSGARSVLRAKWQRGLAGLLLVWSMAVAGTGAFFADTWNTHPASVDRNHDRLWHWDDLQIRRAWQTGPSTQNFNLFHWMSWYADGPPDAGASR